MIKWVMNQKKKNKINNLIKELEEETDDSINSNYFTEDEKKKE